MPLHAWLQPKSGHFPVREDRVPELIVDVRIIGPDIEDVGHRLEIAVKSPGAVPTVLHERPIERMTGKDVQQLFNTVWLFTEHLAVVGPDFRPTHSSTYQSNHGRSSTSSASRSSMM